MISTVKAVTFLKVLRSGRTRPCLMLCEDAAGNQIETVVKLRAGMESGTTGLTCELLASFLANDLDLTVPKPFLVDVDDDFHEAIHDTTPAEMFRKSHGVNFGARYLGAGYITCPQERSIPSSLLQMAGDIFAFDFMIQNPDRGKGNPNILRKSDELVIFDHELAFSFLHAIGKAPYPWENTGADFMSDHVFFRGLKGRELSWERLQGALEAVDDRRLKRYNETVPDSWRQGDKDATTQILGYIEQVRNHSKLLFQKIQEVLI